VVQAYSTIASYTWISTGLPAGTYGISVWVLDSSNPNTNVYDVNDGHDFTLTAGCPYMNAFTSPSSPQPVGTNPVNIYGGTVGCPYPEYRFWILAPGSTWTIVRDYTAYGSYKYNVYPWNTSGILGGTYYISVWVRESGTQGATCGSSGCYDAFVPGFAFTLTATPCTAVSASARPWSPQADGTVVTIVAGASGCPNPLYEFWILPPGGSWTIMQSYSSTATFTWYTISPAGTYYYSVWSRDVSSSASYDAYFPGTAYTLT
jgi:hypothetical protein